MKIVTLSLLAVLFASTSFAGTGAEPSKTSNCSDEKNYPVVEKAELTNLIAQKAAFIVDVNSKDSFTKTHIPSAINFGIEGQKFVKDLPADKNALIVAYCGGPACGAWKKAAEVACKNGYTNIKHFKAGISGWNEAKI